MNCSINNCFSDLKMVAYATKYYNILLYISSIIEKIHCEHYELLQEIALTDL